MKHQIWLWVVHNFSHWYYQFKKLSHILLAHVMSLYFAVALF